MLIWSAPDQSTAADDETTSMPGVGDAANTTDDVGENDAVETAESAQ